MNSPTKRARRIFFLAYVCAAYAAILVAAPLVRAFEPSAKAGQQAAAGSASRGGSASRARASGASAGGSSRIRSFDECDRNHDGFLDKSEAGGVPGLSANFERADANKDGRLDRSEFQRALGRLNTQWK